MEEFILNTEVYNLPRIRRLKDLEEYLYIKLESSQTSYISRAKYIKLIEENFSCLD